MVTTIGIVGLGLMGGSLARRALEAGIDVIAWNRDDSPYRAARDGGITCMDSVQELALARPQLVVLCNALHAMPEVLRALGPVLDRDATTLIDIGSVKAMVRRQVRDAGLADCYVGAHPMAGNERSGFAASDPRLYDNALWAVTVDETTAYRRFIDVAQFITRQLGDRLIVLDDDAHDRAAATISHMPHVISTAMINLLCAQDNRNIAAALAAGSWRDMTRVALTDPARTRAMVEEDHENVEALVRDMAARLEDIADALHVADERRVAAFFAQGDPFRDYARMPTQRGPSSATADTGVAGDAAQRPMRQLTLNMEPSGNTKLSGNTDVSAQVPSWQTQLLTSAERGEQIIRFLDDRTVEVLTRAVREPA